MVIKTITESKTNTGTATGYIIYHYFLSKKQGHCTVEYTTFHLGSNHLHRHELVGFANSERKLREHQKAPFSLKAQIHRYLSN